MGSFSHEKPSYPEDVERNAKRPRLDPSSSELGDNPLHNDSPEMEDGARVIYVETVSNHIERTTIPPLERGGRSTRTNDRWPPSHEPELIDPMTSCYRPNLRSSGTNTL